MWSWRATINAIKPHKRQNKYHHRVACKYYERLVFTDNGRREKVCVCVTCILTPVWCFMCVYPQLCLCVYTVFTCLKVPHLCVFVFVVLSLPFICIYIIESVYVCLPLCECVCVLQECMAVLKAHNSALSLMTFKLHPLGTMNI